MKQKHYRNGEYKRKIVYIEGRPKIEARILMENYLGRKLSSSELVHHVDNNPLNNSVENLQIVTRAEHKKIHKEIGIQTRFSRVYNLNREAIFELFKTKNCTEIALLIGCSQKTISNFVKQFILPNCDLRSFGFKKTKSSYKERLNAN
jgi:hypothetical protein